MGSQSAASAAVYGVPLGLWLIVSVATASAIIAVLVAWASNLSNQRNLKDQLERGWQQTVRQLKHEAEQRSKQRAHDTEQLSARLKHSADEAAREREAALRQGVYMEAAGALLGLHTLLGQMSAADCDEDAVWQIFTAKIARIVQVHLIATEATVEAVMVYLNEIAPGFLELATLRRQLRDQTPARPGGRNLTPDHERDQVLQSLLSGEHPVSLAQRGNPQSDHGSADNGLLDDRVEEARVVRQERRTELCRRAVRLTHQSGKLLATSLLALRNEMAGPLDRRRYDQLWQVLFGKMEFVLKQDMESAGDPGIAIRAAQSSQRAG